mmetsp:Transcript_35143/g.76772  ORF Transcript_35143/g.76772 Transcript_35143/m.76772 type:complete len:240 (+) Transcript_35143:1-720(+)
MREVAPELAAAPGPAPPWASGGGGTPRPVPSPLQNLYRSGSPATPLSPTTLPPSSRTPGHELPAGQLQQPRPPTPPPRPQPSAPMLASNPKETNKEPSSGPPCLPVQTLMEALARTATERDKCRQFCDEVVRATSTLGPGPADKADGRPIDDLIGRARHGLAALCAVRRRELEEEAAAHGPGAAWGEPEPSDNPLKCFLFATVAGSAAAGPAAGPTAQCTNEPPPKTALAETSFGVFCK